MSNRFGLADFDLLDVRILKADERAMKETSTVKCEAITDGTPPYGVWVLSGGRLLFEASEFLPPRLAVLPSPSARRTQTNETLAPISDREAR
jgi:hypothetical protein